MNPDPEQQDVRSLLGWEELASELCESSNGKAGNNREHFMRATLKNLQAVARASFAVLIQVLAQELWPR